MPQADSLVEDDLPSLGDIEDRAAQVILFDGALVEIDRFAQQRGAIRSD